MLRYALAAAVLTAATLAPATAASAASGPCRLAGTAGLADLVPGDSALGLSALPPAIVDLPAQIHLRGTRETFNRRWSFVLREGRIYVKEASKSGGWRTMSLPECLAGHVMGISVDDDDLVALDEAGYIYTMDHALNAPWTWNWTHRFGAPLWLGGGNTVPHQSARWTWSVLSLGEDKVWRDTAGNDHPVGLAKVSHVFALDEDGNRITYVDPWLPADHSYEMATPHRGRFKAQALSTAASTSFVINRYGDMYTRLYDFDISGSDKVFFSYSYQDQRGATFPKIQLPAPDWIRQPKIPGQITDRISIHKTGTGSDARELRVEGRDHGRTGYWGKALTAARWTFTPTGESLEGRKLQNPAEDRSSDTLAPPSPYDFSGTLGHVAARVEEFDVAVAATPLTLRAGGQKLELTLHTVDGLRQTPQAPGLTSQPRKFYGTIEVPQAVLDELDSYNPALRSLVRDRLKSARFTDTPVTVTDQTMTFADLGLSLNRT
ncbi:SdpI family protein [Streptomyces sp. AcE210]|uniref:SdpI family protein n=1 Tax=Streptomyces sp. AcE210 TaxID=2292703 RepID=UPI0019CFCA92|nr:SdpI family protein [Streptomyces sp. AcE210]